MKTRLDPVPALVLAFILIGPRSAIAQPAGTGPGAAPPRPQGPCDIYAAAGDPCGPAEALCGKAADGRSVTASAGAVPARLATKSPAAKLAASIRTARDAFRSGRPERGGERSPGAASRTVGSAPTPAAGADRHMTI